MLFERCQGQYSHTECVLLSSGLPSWCMWCAPPSEIQIRRLCCHTCWVKTSLATYSKRIHTALNNGWCSGRCSIDHVWSECVQQKITCRGEIFLPLKTKSFQHSQSDQIKAYALALISALNLFGIPSNQWPNILATLVGGYKFDVIWMIDHVCLLYTSPSPRD